MTQNVDAPSQSEAYAAATAATIDPADLAKDRRALGVLSASRNQELIGTATGEAIRNFAHGYGDDNPLFTDPDYGRGTRWGGQIAPPIMAAVLNTPLLGDRVGPEQRGGSYRGIHAFVSGGSWEWFRPIRPGDRLYSFSGLESVEEKQSEFAGKSVVRVLRDVKINQRAEVVGIYRTLIIYTERKTARDKGKYSSTPQPRYTPDDIAELDRVYAAEQVRGATPRIWEDIVVGEDLGTMAKGPLTTTDMIVFHAGGYGFVPYGLRTGRLAWRNRQRIPAFYVDNEHGVPDVAQRVHWDSEWARAIGNPRAYDYGVLRECWIHHFVTDWIGDAAFVVSQHDEIRKFNYHGDIQYLTGTVQGKRDEAGMTLVDLAVDVRNQRGETTAQAAATVSVPSRQYGPALLPEPPSEVQRAAVAMWERHGFLGSGGADE